MNYLNMIRKYRKTYSIKKQFAITSGIIFLGIYFGLFSKFLDYYQGSLPHLLQVMDNVLDFHNFLGEFAPWILIGVCISIYSQTPIRAAINVFSFFAGFVSSYYIYSYFIAGFFPRSYALIWIAFTIVSPLFAFISWYAKGKGPISLLISSGIIGTLINTTFAYGAFYIDIISPLNVILLLIVMFILKKDKKETIYMISSAIVFAILIKLIIPFSFYFNLNNCIFLFL